MTLNRSHVQLPFVDSRTIRQHFGTTKFVEARLRSQLDSPIYWIKPAGGRKILWNHRLIQDWLLNGGNTLQHQKLVEQYLQTLNTQRGA